MEPQQNFTTIDPTALARLDGFETAGFPQQHHGLGAKLRAAIEQHSGSSSSAKPFIPISELYAIITPAAIEADLRQLLGLSEQDSSSIVKKVLGTPSFIKVFATLALIGRLDSVPAFVATNANDEILPITVGDVSHDDFPVVFSNNKTATPLTCFQGWKAADVTAFEELMWLSLSPVFLPPSGTTLTEFLEFPSKTPFPFLEDASTFPDRRGGSSTVTNVNIHPAHIDVGENQDWTPSFAVKRLSASRKTEWRREIETLKKFSENPSSNLIPLMAAWQHDDNYFLLFPWAKTDLRSWWRSNPDPASASSLSGKDLNASQWLMSLCLDVSAGLEAFHTITSGYHGDIKPENILWFPDRDNKSTGKWKIADFGLSHFDDKADGSKALERYGCTPGYRAPEYDEKNIPIGQKADVWSLACVFLESAIWCYIGMKGLRDFEAERFLDAQGTQNGDGAFWEQTQNGVMLKPLVSRWLSHLDDVFDGRLVNDDCRSSLVSICRDDMLVPDTEERKPIFDVADKLRTVQKTSTDSSPELAAVPDDLLSAPFSELTSVSASNYVTDLSSLAPLDTDYTTSDIAWSHHLDTLFSYPTHGVEQFITAPEPVGSPSSLLPTQSSGSPTFSDESNSLREYHTTPLQKAAASPPSPSGRKAKKRPAPEPQTCSKDGKGTKSRKTESALRFACPYHKFDPASYGIHDSRWRTCVGPGWTSVHRVKEHIDRKHSIPSNTCMRCLDSFARPADLRSHQRAEPPCKVPEGGHSDHRVTEAQRSQMRRRPKGRSDVDAWSDIYRIVFGLSEGDPVPSPYCDQPSDGSPSTSSPDTTVSQEASLFRFEDYLRNTLLPTATSETAAKIRGYFELADMYRRSESGMAPGSEFSLDAASGMPSVSSIPSTLPQYATTLSSVPSLVVDDGRIPSVTDMYSTVTSMTSEMPPPALDGARSKLGSANAFSIVGTGGAVANASGGGGGAGGSLRHTKRKTDVNYMSAWDPATLSQEDEDFTRILFRDLDEPI